ncbi:MAG: cytochrome c oxidase subunit II [Cycloclasticus sp.]|nr:cytochrome c oxidase subunit II [Cycloclasticus sp.]MBG96696.1 cytochrome c oxidase subunit II [Cycloclasticus sp.]HAI96543.1 cytochrome c oxidase subunit II [Methylococcaceae bacterium]
MIKLKQLFAGGLVLTFMSSVAQAEYGLNLPLGVTETSKQVYDLHMLILWICVVIGVIVFGAMIYSMIYHRKSRGAVASQFHESMAAEIIWTVIPFVILIVMAVPATKVLVEMHDTSEADMKIKVTGYQWKWRYEYIGEGVDFFSTLDAASNEARKLGSDIDPSTVENYLLNVDNPLVIPAGKKVGFLLTASDVIHSWWVPDFGWKKDAIPGFVNEAWVKVDEPGVYRGQCAELCGRDHGFMPIVVEVKSQADYETWLAEQKTGAAVAQVEVIKELDSAELNSKGKDIYNANCVACHQQNGQGVPGVFPAITGSTIATGDINQHIDMIMNGKAGTAMAAFKEQLNDVELAAVVTYQRNSLGNNVGDVVQPTAIAALR